MWCPGGTSGRIKTCAWTPACRLKSLISGFCHVRMLETAKNVALAWPCTQDDRRHAINIIRFGHHASAANLVFVRYRGEYACYRPTTPTIDLGDENSYLLPYHIRNSSLLIPAFDSIDKSNPLPTCFRSGTTTFLVRDWKIWWDPLVWTCLNPRVVKYLIKSREETSGSFCTIRIVLLSN